MFFMLILMLALISMPMVFLNVKSNDIGPVVTPIYEIEDNSWIASDGSEIIFSDGYFMWYQEEGKHEDNYYSGAYDFYIGEEAVEFITTDLSKYGVTEDELEDLFDRNEEYSKENFVVFDLRYDILMMNGEKTPYDNDIPWYGFILEDGTYLDVANMNTATYYKFTMKE